jgi:hypothetical protein
MTMPVVVSTLDHPVIDGDRLFFRLNPDRCYRSRPWADGEFWSQGFCFFAADETGQIRDTNVVIVKRIASGRKRMPFAVSTLVPLHEDALIVDFLSSRGIDPSARRRVAPLGSIL